MKDLRRSLRYLRPYRARIGIAVVCVLLMAGLWGGGLGVMLPAMRILFSEDGVHGWAYTAAAQDKLGLDRMTIRLSRAGLKRGGETIVKVLDVDKVKSDGPAAGKLAGGDWIIGWAGVEAAPTSAPAATRPAGEEIVSADQLAEQLALHRPAGTPVTLLVCPAMQPERAQAVTLTLDAPSWTTDWLLRAAAMFPEARDMPGRLPMLVWILGVMLGVTVLRGVLTFFQEYLVSTAIWRGIMDLRNENYNVVLRLPVTHFSEKGVNDTMSRFLQDTNELARGQLTLLGKTLAEPAKFVAMFIAALYLSWELTLLVCLAGPAAGYVISRLGKTMRKASRRALESWSIILAALEETLFGIRVVKAYTMEGAERRRFLRVNRTLLRQQYKMERVDALAGPLIEIMSMVCVMGAVAWAGYLVLNGKLDQDKFVLWIAALFGMFDPVRKLAKVSNKFHQADAAAQRIFALQDIAPEPRVPGAPALPRHSRSIEFEGVSYRYPGATTDALNDVSISIISGQTVAFVGPNGSGKTTLLSLVPRLLAPAAGCVRIDGEDIAGVSLRSLRRQIGLVTQESVVFHATLRENIAYGLRRPHEPAVLAAAKQAYVDEFAAALPAGYDTVVGEHGSTLSGGQKQRIAIARAILRDPAILIFDEALSQIDPDSEAKIDRALEEFRRGRTTLVIAHRFSTIVDADRIVVLDAGRIVDSGTHAQLLERCPLYRQLYQTQFSTAPA